MKAGNQIISLDGLSKEQIELIKEFVEFLRARARVNRGGRVKTKKIAFATHPSNVKVDITREEIYDHL